MKLINARTSPEAGAASGGAGRSAKLLRNISPRDDRMIGCVIARVVYVVGEDGELSIASDVEWPIGSAPAKTPLGKMPGDKPFYMGGVDVLIGGRVYQPERSMRDRLSVELSVGSALRRRIDVIGDRRWVRGAKGALVASAPEAFSSMDLDYELAFGGRAPTTDGQAAPYGPNPMGRGYFLNEESAEGRPLPNLEDPRALVHRWDDRPTPVALGYYPEDGSLRPQASIDHPGLAGVIGGAAKATPPPADFAVTVEHLTPTLFNQGHPGAIIPAEKAPRPGDQVRLTHGRPDGSDLAFLVPGGGFHLHVQLGDRERVVPLHLDQIGIVAGRALVMLSHRVVFEYRLVPGERRVCSLYEGPAPEVIPAHYRRDLRDEWDEASFGGERLG